MALVQVVGAALLRKDPAGPGRQVLAAQRAEPPALAGLWEFPGGKVDPGESDVQALVRELREELGIEVEVGRRVGPDLDLRGTGVLRVYTAVVVSGEPTALEHRGLRWLAAPSLLDVPWIPADLPALAPLELLLRQDPGRPTSPR